MRVSILAYRSVWTVAVFHWAGAAELGRSYARRRQYDCGMHLVVGDRGRARGRQGAMDTSCMSGTQAVSLLEWAAVLCAPGISTLDVCVGADTAGVAKSADIVTAEREGG